VDVVEIALSVLGSWTGAPLRIVMEFVQGMISSGAFGSDMGDRVNSRISEAEPGSTLANAKPSGDERPLMPRRSEQVAAVAANDVPRLGLALGPDDVNGITVTLLDFPGSLIRRPKECKLLDVAFGVGSVGVAKYLLEFHSAVPTRETLRAALSVGNLELIRLAWQRLPEEQVSRVDLLEVAADFHREEPLAWLIRDATDLEREVFAEFALERHLADALLVAFESGQRIWSRRCRALVGEWPAVRGIDLYEAPEGLSGGVGWVVYAGGRVVPLPATWGDFVLPAADRDRVVRVTSPWAATGLGERGFSGCYWLLRVNLPVALSRIGNYAFLNCHALARLRLPPGVTDIGDFAFAGCMALRALDLPDGLVSIGDWAFDCCACLTRISIPSSVTRVSNWVFNGCFGLANPSVPDWVASVDFNYHRAGVGDRGMLDGIGSQRTAERPSARRATPSFCRRVGESRRTTCGRRTMRSWQRIRARRRPR
jgi:hypothetical protein